nr:MAG TPA: hypothetical protein [Caudoviricetes sp.]
MRFTLVASQKLLRLCVNRLRGCLSILLFLSERT